jgi:hypothetical protein
MSAFLQGLLGQVIGLVTFFAFPALQYLWLRRLSYREGSANLSFSVLGFRVAVANQFGKRVISDMRWRAIVRKLRPSPDNPQLDLCDDTELHSREDFFLFPGGDQILAAFTLRQDKDHVALVSTSVTGNERQRVPINDNAFLICDFIGTVENPLNFGFRVAKRVIVSMDELLEHCNFDPRRGQFVPKNLKCLLGPPIVSIRDIDSGGRWKPVSKKAGTNKVKQSQLTVAHNPGPQPDGTAGAAPRG